MSYWILNGFELDRPLLTRTIDRMLERHRASGVTSDVSWALAFCLEHKLAVGKKAGEVLAYCEDDCIALQALHCKSMGLLTKGFSTKQINLLLKDVDLDGEHWLLGYEALRQGFTTASKASVQTNPLFSDFLKYGVTFYRTQLPAYAMVVHPGGAPEWTVRLWLDLLQGRREVPEGLAAWTKKLDVVKLIEQDLQAVESTGKSRDEALAAVFEAHAPAIGDLLAEAEPYS